jgi:hypothetical protein
MALLSGTVRMPWLHSVCGVAEGAAPSAATDSHSAVVSAVLFDRFGRLTVMGGRPGCARSLGNVYACAIALFLGSSFRGRRTTRLGEHPERCSLFETTRDGASLVVMDWFIADLSVQDARTGCWMHDIHLGDVEIESGDEQRFFVDVENVESFAVAPDGQVYVLFCSGGPEQCWMILLSPTLEVQRTVKLPRDVCHIKSVGHTVLATDDGFYCRATGTPTYLFPRGFGGYMCFMPGSGHFAHKCKESIHIYDGAGTGNILRYIDLQLSLARLPIIRASEAGEFVLAGDERDGPGPRLVLCDADGILRRNLSYCYFDEIGVGGGKVFAQLAEWYRDAERWDIVKALGFRHVFE